MARPQFSEPIYPSQQSPSSTATASCGRSWDKPFEIRAPYKSTDKYSNMLPLVFVDREVASHHTEESLPIVMGTEFRGALNNAIIGAWEILENYDSDGYIDAANKEAISKLIKRAGKYVERANEIKKWWEDEYRPATTKPVYGWPLEDDRMPGCLGFSPSTGKRWMVNQEIEFPCPTDQDRENHDQDRSAYHNHLIAAMVNVRCAQEAAAAVGTYNRNKEFAGNIPGGMKLGQAKPKVKLTLASKAPTTGDIPEDEPPEDELIVEDEPESKPAKKKKSNALLLVGAAGLGLLMMGRK